MSKQNSTQPKSYRLKLTSLSSWAYPREALEAEEHSPQQMYRQRPPWLSWPMGQHHECLALKIWAGGRDLA